MEGRNAMAMSGPGASPYYIHRGLSGSPGSGSQPGLHAPQGMRTLANPSTSLPVPSATVGGSVSTAFQVEPSPALSQHGINVGGQGSSVAQGEPVKRKRGRPRKYGPDGTMSLGLSPLSSPAGTPGSGAGSSGMGVTGSGSSPSSQKRGRGRPPGTGRKQQLASCGEWISSSAGMGFTPHIITISPGEMRGARGAPRLIAEAIIADARCRRGAAFNNTDIASKIMSFSQQGPRAVCILSANGAVSTVTLRQAASSGGTVTYEGRFEILGLTGSYLLSDSGGSRSRSGGLSISLSSPDGRVIGGGVGGLLIAASPVQVIVGSFMYGGTKPKNKPKPVTDSAGSELDLPVGGGGGDKPMTPTSSTPPSQGLNPVLSGWPGSRQVDIRNTHIDIDLTRG
ncbi:hypothetical protein Taro_026993 [Colocasia esculenta]|uniref:AT-hook motif nuclear-localized protein n=1 Tax=Colocasia esculenta TaxID=4460 RepID=A0A843VEF0_COLES|nr:hypothetical protein [Colocasia esculenta]